MNALDRKEKKLILSNFVFFNKEHRDKSIVLTYPSCAGCPGMSEGLKMWESKQKSKVI